MLIMFVDFYIKAYIKKPKSENARKILEEESHKKKIDESVEANNGGSNGFFKRTHFVEAENENLKMRS